MSQSRRLIVFLLCLCAPLLCLANFHLEVSGDVRRVMDLGTFGFSTHGEFEMQIFNFMLAETSSDKLHPFINKDGVINSTEPIGFALDMVRSSQSARVEKNVAKQDAAEKRVCFLDDYRPLDNATRILFPLNGKKYANVLTTPFRATIANKPGLYALFFYNCKGLSSKALSVKNVAVSFNVFVSMYNVDANGNKNFLSAGEESLPYLYMFFGVAFLVLGFLWFRFLQQKKEYTHKIHWVMLVLILLKGLSLVTESLKLGHFSVTGSRSAWDFFYYVLLTAKGVTLFSVVILIGTGWSILKAFLSEQDKKLLLFIVPCQVVINISIAVVEETSEGSKNWINWLNMLRVLDIICCCCVLLPIVWSIKNLREASGQDDKMMQTLSRMRQFRTFYILVVAYIYFTRIVIPMVEGTVPFSALWFARFLRETAALAFYAYVGWKFVPSKDSAYTHLEKEDMEELEQRQEIGGAVVELGNDPTENPI